LTTSPIVEPRMMARDEVGEHTPQLRKAVHRKQCAGRGMVRMAVQFHERKAIIITDLPTQIGLPGQLEFPQIMPQCGPLGPRFAMEWTSELRGPLGGSAKMLDQVMGCQPFP